jgi:lipopolysaccharide export system protein LptA
MRPGHTIRSATWSVLFAVFSGMAVLAPPVAARQVDASAPGGNRTEEVEISADSLSFRRIGGLEIVDMIGAYLTQGDTALRSDFATDEGNGFVTFRGNVVITELGDTVRADHIRYEKATKVGIARGNLRISDGEVVLTAPSGRWYSREKQTHFDEGVQFVDSLSVLTAERGIYQTELERAEFSGGIRLHREDTDVWADSVRYDRPTQESWASGRVAVVTRDSTGAETARLFGDRVYRHEAADSTVIRGNVFVGQFEAGSGDASADTLFVTSGRAWLRGDFMAAMDSVVVSASGRALRGDSLVAGDGWSRIHGDVRTWLQSTQVTADSMAVEEQPHASVDSVFAWGRVFVAREDSATGRINQMKAGRLAAGVAADTLTSLLMMPNAEVLLYIVEDGTGRELAFNASADAVEIGFSGGEPDRLVFTGQTAGTEYTRNLFNRLKDLAGYIWIPEDRPDRTDLTARFHALSADRTAF